MENDISKKIQGMLAEAKAISTTYPDKSYEMSKEAYELSKENHLKQEEGLSLIGMSLACRSKSEISKMLDYSYGAFEIFESLQEPSGQVKSLNLIGIAYFYSSMYERALKYFLQALDLLEQFNDASLLVSVLNNSGEVFRESGNYDAALEYYNRAFKMSLNIESKIYEASLLNNIGEVHYMRNEYKEAMEYFTNSYDLLIKEKDMIILGEVESRLGKVHYINENYSKAEEYFFNSLKRLDKVNNKFYAIDVLLNIARLQLIKDPKRSFYYFEKAIHYAEKTNARKKLSELYKILGDYYEKTCNFREALEYFKRYHSIEQEIATSIVGNKLEILKIELGHLKENYKMEKAEMVNQRLEMEISNQRNELEKIQNLNKVLEKKALEDELTGVPNRAYINYQLNKAWEECSLKDGILALFIIDIDNFKKYNDFWGHVKGDECLKTIANCLRDIQESRKDVFGRYGGEEFIYFTEGINYDQALELGNLIRSNVEKLCLRYTSGSRSSIVTVSVGGALGKPQNFKNVSDIIEIADKELYKAKNNGRNIISLNSLVE